VHVIILLMDPKDLKISFVPLHQQLVANLLSEINSGKFKQGDFFATEKSLMENFGLSSTTIRRALQLLVQQGNLYRKAGKGTFIRRPQIKKTGGPLWSFHEEMEALGLKPTSDLLSIEVQKAKRFIAQKLQLPKSEPIYWIKKLLRANQEAVAILDSYWQFDVGKGLSQHNLNSVNLFSIVENELGISLGEAEDTIEAGAASAEEAQLLGIPEKTPILIRQRIVYSVDGRPICLGFTAYRAGIYKYRTWMIRGANKIIRNYSDKIGNKKVQ
jgi:GntR family transcriptional regulator